MWQKLKLLGQWVLNSTVQQFYKIPAGVRVAIAQKLVRNTLSAVGGGLAFIGWSKASVPLNAAGDVAFVAGVALSVLDAYRVHNKIAEARDNAGP